MSAAAISHYSSNVVRYEPQAAQRPQDAAAQMQQRQQLSTAQLANPRSPAEQTLEGELLNKQAQRQPSGVSEEAFLAQHQAERARSTEGYHSQTDRALAAYQTNALLTQPADVDRIGFLDVYV